MSYKVDDGYISRNYSKSRQRSHDESPKRERGRRRRSSSHSRSPTRPPKRRGGGGRSSSGERRRRSTSPEDTRRKRRDRRSRKSESSASPPRRRNSDDSPPRVGNRNKSKRHRERPESPTSLISALKVLKRTLIRQHADAVADRKDHKAKLYEWGVDRLDWGIKDIKKHHERYEEVWEIDDEVTAELENHKMHDAKRKAVDDVHRKFQGRDIDVHGGVKPGRRPATAASEDSHCEECDNCLTCDQPKHAPHLKPAHQPQNQQLYIYVDPATGKQYHAGYNPILPDATSPQPNQTKTSPSPHPVEPNGKSPSAEPPSDPTPDNKLQGNNTPMAVEDEWESEQPMKERVTPDWAKVDEGPQEQLQTGDPLGDFDVNNRQYDDYVDNKQVDKQVDDEFGELREFQPNEKKGKCSVM